MREVVFVYLGNKLPKYVNASLEIAGKFSGLDIILLGNSILRKQIKNRNVKFIAIEDFYNSTNFMEVVSKINLPISFRDGFWSKTLERFFVIHQYMDVYDVDTIFHAELDQLLFRCDKLLESLEDSEFKGIALPFHKINLGVASVFYCNEIKYLESLLNFTRELFSFNNEMEVIAQWAVNNPQLIKFFPTIATELEKNDLYHLSGMEIIPSSTIDGIVDAAQIGQWIGGIDPRNVSIRNTPKNKYTESPSGQMLSFNELSNIHLTLSADGSLKILYENSKLYNLYNVHLHSKIHPWIVKTPGNLSKLLNKSNQVEPSKYSASRRIQISHFITTGFNSFAKSPIEFLKRSFSRLFK